MKHYLLICLSAWAFQAAYAQSNLSTGQLPPPACGTSPSIVEIGHIDSLARANAELAAQFTQNRSLLPVAYIPIKAHIGQRSDGSGGLTAMQLSDAIADMNGFFINANMQFYLCGGINYIQNDNYYNFSQGEQAEVHGTHGEEGLINIYFFNRVRNDEGGELCGYAYFPGGPDVIVMRNSCATNGSTLAHEMGHYFSLYHTHGLSNTTLTDELVDGSNCTTAGDRVCDTPADPQLGSSNVNSSCLYTGTAVDANGDPFVPDPRNLMSYSRKNCRDFFSPQQYGRMYASYVNDRSYLFCPSFNVDFNAESNVNCAGAGSVTFTAQAAGADSYSWDVDGDGAVDYSVPNFTHAYTAAGKYDVQLEITGPSGAAISKTKADFVQLGALPVTFYEQDFQSLNTGLPEGWSGDSEAYRWRVNAGPTPSTGTGPASDASTGTADGQYLYAEASFLDYGSGDPANLVLPCMELGTGSSTLSFAYHMYGGGMGSLHLDIELDGAWQEDIMPPLSGPQQASPAENWAEQTVDLSAFAGQSIRLRFRALLGSNFQSDIAIDEVVLNSEGSGPLPVEWLSFNAHPEGGGIRLDWSTATELNNAGFELQYSSDKRDWAAIHFAEGGGTRQAPAYYSYVDVDPYPGSNYYRLKQLDYDGQYTYSTIASAQAPDAAQWKVWPNPARHGQVHIAWPAGSSLPVTLRLQDVSGRQIRQWEQGVQEGGSRITLGVSGLPSGLYFLEAVQGSHREVQALRVW